LSAWLGLPVDFDPPVSGGVLGAGSGLEKLLLEPALASEF